MTNPNSDSALPNEQILAQEVKGTSVTHLSGFLKKQRNFFSDHSDYDSFVEAYITAEEETEGASATATQKRVFKSYKQASTLLVKTRIDLINVLWKHNIYLSTSVVDRIIFTIICDPSATNLSQEFFKFVLERRLYEPGFVLYPIHSFGILGFGALRLLREKSPYLNLIDAGVLLTPQTNSQKATLEFLDAARAAFGIQNEIPENFQYEFDRSVLSWMTRNPLLAVKIASTTSGYYENQFIIKLKLRMASTLILMLAALAKTDRTDRNAYNFSTARTNNWQTLDIHHYVVFEVRAAIGKLDVLRTPMNLSTEELVNLSEISVDIDPNEWAKHENTPLLHQASEAIAVLERQYLENWIIGDKKNKRSRVIRKIYLSLEFFHRSFRSTQNEDEAVVALAIAFETLLTDGYQRGGVRRRVSRRVPLCLAQSAEAHDLNVQVQKLMERRGNVVHEGDSDIDLDLNAARRAYVQCFFAVMSKINLLQENVSQPIGELLGDKPTPRKLVERLKSAWKELVSIT